MVETKIGLRKNNYRIGVIGVIVDKDQILIGKKGIHEGHFLSGQWHIPGGKAEQHETPEQAIIREMQEETGIQIKIEKVIDEVVLEDRNLKILWFLCSPLSFELKAADDLVDVKYVHKSQVKELCSSRGVYFWPKGFLDYLNN
jgi:8-oxo-dGTP diphosphatase